MKPRVWSVVAEGGDAELRIRSYQEGDDLDRVFLVKESDERCEAREAEHLRDQWPERWPDWASPERMKRDLEREQEEDERR